MVTAVVLMAMQFDDPEAELPMSAQPHAVPALTMPVLGLRAEGVLEGDTVMVSPVRVSRSEYDLSCPVPLEEVMPTKYRFDK
jgi:hypothetical protein